MPRFVAEYDALNDAARHREVDDEVIELHGRPTMNEAEARERFVLILANGGRVAQATKERFGL